MKEKILIKLHEHIDKQIANAQHAMEAAQESAMSEGKSSAGDKFETGRAMAHRDRDMYAQQLALALNEKEVLHKINTKIEHTLFSLGSLVDTTAGLFFISISMGKIVVDDVSIYAVSPQAPICVDMMGKKVGESFMVQDRKHSILGLS
jgi:hypothetical protein